MWKPRGSANCPNGIGRKKALSQWRRLTLAGTALESGKSYIATVDGITEKTGESTETNYLTYDNGTLIVIGTVEITCDSAGLSFYNGTLTLAGNGDLTIAASGSNSAGVRFPSKHTDYSGGIFRQHYLGQRKCPGCPECGAGSDHRGRYPDLFR